MGIASLPAIKLLIGSATSHMRRIFSNAIILVSLGAQPVWAARRCEHALNHYPIAKVKLDLEEGARPSIRIRTENVGDVGETTLNVFRDKVTPAMYLLERLDEKRHADHELRTARDYAEFVYRRHGQNFVFTGIYDGLAVPLFDGFLADGFGRPFVNISLKYIASRATEMNIEALIKKLKLRFAYNYEKIPTPVEWFVLVNNLQAPKRNDIVSAVYHRHLSRASLLGSLFGFLGTSYDREIRTVIDLRDSGYDFNYVSQPEMLAAIQQMLMSLPHSYLSLTLIWDPSHVIEFKGNKVSVHEPEPAFN